MTETVPPRVVVANSSSNPETIHSAIGLAGAGMLARYHVPLATTPGQRRRARRLLPGPPGRALERELARRALPAEVPRSVVKRTALLSDMRRVAAARLRSSQGPKVRHAHRHRATFDRAVARRLRSSDDALLAIAGIARHSLTRARELGIVTALDCPLSHHRQVREMMREEIRLQPEWAVTMQGHDIPDELLEAYERELELADVVLVISSHARSTFRDRGLADSKLITTPLGVDLDLFRSSGPEAGDRDGDAFRVVFSGQITQRKGLSYLIEGFRKAAISGSELLLIGQVIGSSAPWEGVPGVRHVPAVPRAELPSLYRGADVYVLPSLEEGFGLTALEAMASGLPTIVSEHTFADDVIADGRDGFIVPIRDSEAIAERLRLLAADPDARAGLGAAARERAEDFPWSAYSERVVATFRELVGKDAPRPASSGRRAITATETNS